MTPDWWIALSTVTGMVVGGVASMFLLDYRPRHRAVLVWLLVVLGWGMVMILVGEWAWGR